MEDSLDNILISPSEPPAAPPPKKHTTKKTPDTIRSKVKELIASGKSVREVGIELGISKSTAATIAKETKAAEPEKIPEVQAEPMDDASFAAAISSIPAAAPTAKAVPRGGGMALDSLLAEFENIDTVPKAKGRKAAPKASMMTELVSVKPPKPPAPEYEDKSVYITKIQMNVDNFPEVLKDHIKPDRDGFIAKVCKMPVAELHHTLKLLETVRSSNNMANQLKYLLYGATTFIEIGTQKFLGLKTQGYAMMVRQQEAEIQSCLREIAINNVESYKKVEKPEMRLATVLVTTLLATDSRNRMEAVRNDFKSRPMNPEKEKEYEEL